MLMIYVGGGGVGGDGLNRAFTVDHKYAVWPKFCAVFVWLL